MLDASITSPQHTQGQGSSRAGLCPLPKSSSRRAFVNEELKSRGQLLCAVWGRLDPRLGTLTCLQYKAIPDFYSSISPGGRNTRMHSSSLYINFTSKSALMETQEENSHLFLRKQDQTLSTRKIQSFTRKRNCGPAMLSSPRHTQPLGSLSIPAFSLPPAPTLRVPQPPSVTRPKCFRDLGVVLSRCTSLPERAEHGAQRGNLSHIFS